MRKHVRQQNGASTDQEPLTTLAEAPLALALVGREATLTLNNVEHMSQPVN